MTRLFKLPDFCIFVNGLVDIQPFKCYKVSERYLSKELFELSLCCKVKHWNLFCAFFSFTHFILDPGQMLNLMYFVQINEALQSDPGDYSSVDKKLIEWSQERIKGYDHSSDRLEDK